MNKQAKNALYLSLGGFLAFAALTLAVFFLDRQPVGPRGSVVGLAGLNSWAHRFFGVCLPLYTLTDWLSLIPLGCIAGFGVLGLAQWLGRRSLKKVDADLLALGGFYIVVLAAFLLFEQAEVNFRPVLLNGVLETSYPSSTTLLVLCVMPTAAWQLQSRLRKGAFQRCVVAAVWVFTLFMVAGRLLSGVHWLTDILAGILLSVALLSLYRCLTAKQ